MTRSLPARSVTSADASASTPKPGAREKMLNVAGTLTLHTIPRMPDRLKQLLLGGRPVTIDGNTLDPTLALVLAAQRASGTEGLIISENVALARRGINAAAKQFPHVDVDVEWSDLSLPGPAGDIPARHYRSKEADAPLLVYYHGGGFVVGGLETHGQLCEVICRDAGVHVLFVDYRLAPEHKAPAAADDAYAAYLWACEHAAELGADPSRVAVGGDSAGGNLAAVVALRARDEGAPAPVLQLLLYPMVNFAGHTRSQDLFADGFFLRRWDHGLLPRQIPQWFGHRPHRSRGCRRCWPRICPVCRPPSWSPRASTRCETRTASTPRRCVPRETWWTCGSSVR